MFCLFNRWSEYGKKETICAPDVILSGKVSWANKLVKWIVYEEDIWVDSNDDTLPYLSD